MQNMRSEIENLIVKDENTGKAIEEKNTVETFADNVKLLKTIPGIGRATALTIMSEIGDINKLHKPKQLVAYFGVDPSVNQSGKFESDRNKMSKRGTSIGRRVIYHAALVAIGKNKSGEPNNYVLREYYKENLKGKKKKQGIGAIMNKIHLLGT